MELKDIVSISISSFAFVLSLAATAISVVRSNHEKQRAIKKELTDTLAKIVSTSLENIKLYRDSPNDPRYFHAASGILNQQNAFLMQQATYLADQVPRLVTAVEYNTIAAAMANSGDLISAERFYQKAISASLNDFHRSATTRSYANFLFLQHRFEEARERFGKSISLLTGGGNFERYTTGMTYQLWAWNELYNANSPKRAEELFESAGKEFAGIDNESVRQNAMRGLSLAKGSPTSPNPAQQSEPLMNVR